MRLRCMNSERMLIVQKVRLAVHFGLETNDVSYMETFCPYSNLYISVMFCDQYSSARSTIITSMTVILASLDFAPSKDHLLSYEYG